jgi:tetratricopeptide (TPR) repeat protein
MFKKIILGLILILLITNQLRAQDISAGVKLIRNEKFNSAKKYFYSLLTTDKKAESYFYLGQIFYLTENYDSAKISYLNGISADPEQPLNYAGLVKINLLSNEISEADKNIKNALELGNEKSPLVYITLSEAYSNSKVKDYSKASELISNAIKIDPTYIDAYISLSNVDLLKGDGTEAIKNSEEILNIDNKNSEALTIKAEVYILINKNNEAIGLLNDAIKYDSSYSPAFNELAELYADLKDYSKAAEYYEKYIQASEVTIEKQKRYASILYVNKEYEKTINILEDVLRTEKNSASTIRIIAYSYLRLGNVDKSKYYFEKLFQIKSAEFLPTDYENYADLLSKTGNEIQALDYLAKVIELDSTRKDIYGKMSVIYFKNKNWDGVIRSLTEKGSLTAQEYFDLSKAYIFKGDGNITNALQTLTSKVKMEIEQIDKTRQILLYYQGDLFKANGDTQKIVEAKSKTIQSVEALLNNNQKKDWNLAKDDWSNLIESTISTEYAKADSCLNILVTKAPNLTIAYVWQARVKADFDPDSENGLAKPFYEKFIQLANPESDKFKKELIESYSYLGYYYYLQKDNSKAKSYWQEVLKLDPENKQANDVIKQLK